MGRQERIRIWSADALAVLVQVGALRDQLAEDATSRYRRSSGPKHQEMVEELLAGV